MEEKNSSLNIKKNKSENIEKGENISEFIDREEVVNLMKMKKILCY